MSNFSQSQSPELETAQPKINLSNQPFHPAHLVLLLSLGLLPGCFFSPSIVSAPEAVSPANPFQRRSSPLQAEQLPILAEVEIGDERIQLEVARTPQEQAMGLMFRTELPLGRGMLFPFESACSVRFWMRNTLIPLDIVFLLNGEVREIVASAPPCRQFFCPTYSSLGPVNQVIELSGGRAEELNLQVGDRLEIRFLRIPSLLE